MASNKSTCHLESQVNEKIAYPAAYRAEAIHLLHPIVVEMVCRLPEEEELVENFRAHYGQAIDYTVWTSRKPLPRLSNDQLSNQLSVWCILRQFDELVNDKYQGYLSLKYTDHGTGLNPRFYLYLADGISPMDL